MAKVGSLWFWLAGLLGALVIGLVSLRYTSVFSTEILKNREAWGQFGDYFGGILNPLLSFAAFITLLINLRVQLTANLKSGAESLEQVREQRFFQLLNLVSQNALNSSYNSSYKVGNVAITRTGHVALHHAWQEFREHYLKDIPRSGALPIQLYKEVEKQFWAFKRTAWPSINAFVESSFLLLEFVTKNGTVNDGFVRFAVLALKAQTTESERLLLWYSALGSNERPQILIFLNLINFAGTANNESPDPLFRNREELVKCALVQANMSG